MGTKLRIIAFLICVHASEVTQTQTPWKIKTASTYEIDFYDSKVTNFDKANELCEDNAGIMVKLDNEEVRNAVYTTISSATVDFFWIGAIGRLKNWRWLDRSPVEGSILTWYGGQPDNYNHGRGKGETRLIIQKKDNKYGDVDDGFSSAGTICLRAIVWKVSNRKLTIHRYDSNGDTMALNYENAKSMCESMSSRLAVVDGTTRYTLKAKLKTNEYHWVGTTATVGCKAFAKYLETTPNCNQNRPYVCEQVGTYGVATSSLTLTAASAKLISCTAKGFPTPSVVWEKDGVRVSVSSTGGVYQTSGDGLARLRLENAYLTDEGKYECVASNTIDGTVYKKTAIAQLKVPSAPTILSIEPQSCNSSFIIKWEPHQRAIGVEHKIKINKNRGTYEQQVTSTPNDEVQFFVSTNLTSSTLYFVLIHAKTYWDKKQNYTGGVPKPVQTARLSKANEYCKVNWNWPRNTPQSLLTGFKVKTTFTTARFAAGTNVLTETEEETTNSLSITIPMRPNRNHTVTIRSQTCAGFGKAVIAEGVCVTNVEAPSSISTPSTGNGTEAVSEDGKLNIMMTIPSQTNGTISCVFVIIEIGNSTTATGFNEAQLAKANGTGNGKRYIAVAMDQERIKGKSELNITLGDGSITRCNIQDKQMARRKRETPTENTYVGQNDVLSKDKSHNIYVVTSTPSDAKVFFQISPPLEMLASPTGPGGSEAASQGWLIPVVVVVVLLILIALVVAGIVLKRRYNKQQPLTSDKREVLKDTDISQNVIASEGLKRIIPPRHQGSDNAVISVDVNQEHVLYENYKDDTKVQMSDFEAYYNHLCQEECAIFMTQFQTIVEKAVANMQSTFFAANPRQKKKNRYKNILPFDSTRVVIKGNESGYINACYIKGFDNKRKFIATQGPLPSTVNDFWIMVIENDCKIIVMLAKCFEAGKKKCEKYWPEQGKSEKHGAITVQNKAEVKSCGYILRKFQVSYEGGAIDVLQFQYLNWPDHGVPKTTSTLIRMHKAVVKSWKVKQSSSPMIVHCSAGAGRTGTFIGYDILLEQSSQDNQADVFDCVLKMRSQRVDMVQTCDQYILVHKLVLEQYLFADTDMDSRELTKKLQNMNDRGYSRQRSAEFENLSRLAPLKSTSPQENSENLQAVLVIPRPSEKTPPKLNSTWVESYDENSPMIAAHPPDDDSVSIFWRAVSDNRVNTIVMLSGGKEHVQYWPTSVGEAISFDGVAVCLLSEDCSSIVVERTMQIQNGSKQSTVTQYHYPELGVNNCPDNSDHILKLVHEMQKSTRKENRSAVLIHCSDGVGRTGTFCAIVNLIERLKIESRVDVFRAVKDLRDCRPGMVRSLDQYLFCHRVVNDYLKSFDTYSNFG